MIIGHFIYDTLTDTFTGAITTLTTHLVEVRIYPNEEPCRELPFDYWVGAQTPRGLTVFGSANEVVGKHGLSHLSIVLDDPALPKPITAMLWRSYGGTGATLVWARPKRRWLGS